MRAPDFWYPAQTARLGLASRLLWPLGECYHAAGLVKRHFTTPFHADIPVICIGNLSVGGTGKTPLAHAVARWLVSEDL